MDWMQIFKKRPAERTSGVVPGDLSHFTGEALVVQSASRNGYEREAAVAEMLRRGGGEVIKALLPRANDYIPQIRMRVMAAVPTFFEGQFVPDWIAARDELMALYRLPRGELIALRESIERFLSPFAEQIAGMAREDDREFGRWLFTLRLRGCMSAAETEALSVTAVGGADPVLADRALMAVDRLADPAVSQRMALAALRSPLPKVRADGVRLLSRGPGADSRRSTLQAACFDNGSTVRALAFGALDDAGRGHVLDLARACLDDAKAAPAPQVAALHLLVLGGDDEVPASALARVGAASPSLRAAAWASRWQALKTAPVSELEKALVDPSSGVRRLALKQIKGGAPAPSTDWLRATGLDLPHCLGVVISALRHASPWERLRFLLDALPLSAADSARRSSILAELRGWHRDMTSCYINPNADQVAAIRASWLRRPADATIRADLDWMVAPHLQAFGIT